MLHLGRISAPHWAQTLGGSQVIGDCAGGQQWAPTRRKALDAEVCRRRSRAVSPAGLAVCKTVRHEKGETRRFEARKAASLSQRCPEPEKMALNFEPMLAYSVILTQRSLETQQSTVGLNDLKRSQTP